MRISLPTLTCSCALLASGLAAQQTWTPDFELRTTTTKVRTGQSFTVTFHVSKVGGTTAGYQSEVLFDPTRVVPTSIVQGSRSSPTNPFPTQADSNS